jgi:hypothetical protein
VRPPTPPSPREAADREPGHAPERRVDREADRRDEQYGEQLRPRELVGSCSGGQLEAAEDEEHAHHGVRHEAQHGRRAVTVSMTRTPVRVSTSLSLYQAVL